ncbi:recombinase [Candidatus Poribacteria bacterium]|nr:recombinase [Candidatus Poribacteria bacterium]
MNMKMLLHICCAPCSTHVVKEIREEFNDTTGFFYNPNIHPKKEYLYREQEMKEYAGKIGLPLVCAEYDDGNWFELTRGMENIPEGGQRCFLCYRMRLEKTVQYAVENGYEIFTTTLSVSPHKNARVINRIGAELAEKYNLKFYPGDFKKRGGFEKSVQMSKEAGLYRQSYCGCIFSQREAEKRRRKKH